MLNSDDLAFFSVISSASSLAEGARQLNVTPPAVTQRLKAMEARLGVRLLERSSGRLSLTDEGELVLTRALMVAETLETLGEELSERRQTIRGHLRVAAPYGFGRRHVAPALDSFARAHADITAMLDLSDAPAARLGHDCDIAIHIGERGQMSSIVTTLAPNGRILCASPAYLANAPGLAVLGDLVRHRCLVVQENHEDVTMWRFHKPPNESSIIRIRPALSANDGSVIRDWALQGQGIILRSQWDVADDVANGRLVHLLPDWECPRADVVAILGERNGRSRRVGAFLNHLRRALTPTPWLPTGPWPD